MNEELQTQQKEVQKVVFKISAKLKRLFGQSISSEKTPLKNNSEVFKDLLLQANFILDSIDQIQMHSNEQEEVIRELSSKKEFLAQALFTKEEELQKSKEIQVEM